MSRSDDRQAIDLVMELLALPGPSGGEQPVADFIRARLTAAGAPAAALDTDAAYRKSPPGGGCGNLVLRLPGTEKAPRRLLMAHMDTVPLCAGARPVRKGRRIAPADRATGLGGDDRAGCGVILAAALAILQQQLPHPPLTFLWTVQEEAGLHGARYLRLPMLRSPKLAFNWDGGPAHRVTLGATGGYRMGITVHGLASHAGVHPEQGVSAIATASLAIARLVNDGWHGLIEQDGLRGTSNVGVIQGGSATNVVADRIELRAEARAHDPRFRQRIVAQIEQAFANAAQQVCNADGVAGRAEFDGRLDYESFKLSRDEPCVTAAVAALAAEGLEPDYAIANGGLDANWLTARGIPTVTLGCGQNEIHTTKEWLDLDHFTAACRVAQRLAVC
ncbi:MAG: M20/M25/M40 family metallo-hydrolase [Pirellulales bacterium]|nr:M20/M25/M40 family metallo-hydrolase [Pirellulales bacterium]